RSSGIKPRTRKFSMAPPHQRVLVPLVLSLVCLAAQTVSRLAAQSRATNGGAVSAAVLGEPVATPPATVVRLTIAEAKQRALSTSKLLGMASLNAESKAYAIRAIRAMYFPQVAGTAAFLHFQDPLGTVLTRGGRTLSGPRGQPLLVFPPTTIEAAVMNQDSSFVGIFAAQPITDLLEVRQGLQQIEKQIVDLQEQLNALLDLPLCTRVELVPPPLPVVSFRCADEVVGLALANSPEIREAQQTIAKADAAVRAGKLDY